MTKKIKIHEEVMKAVRKLKNNKSTGLGGTPAIAKEIDKLCMKIWETGRWPQNW